MTAPDISDDPAHRLSPDERRRLLTLTDDELLDECRVALSRGSGPGGQKRNTTESAVRITHPGTGVSAASDRTRSQHTNRRVALRALRKRIALNCRVPTPPRDPGPEPASRKDPRHAQWLAIVFDHLEAHDYAVGAAAAELGLSTNQLVQALARDADAWQKVNTERQRRDLRPLRRNR